MGPAALEGAREERSTDGREPRRPDVQPSRRMRRAERRGARASRGGAVGEGPPQTQEPREGVPGRPPEEPSAVPRPPGPRGQTLASAFVSQLSPEPGKPGVGRPPPAGSMRPEEALASGRSELRAAALARVHAAERPVLTAGPLRGKAGGPPAPSPSSPAAWALSSDRLCPGSHAHWLWTSLFLADHLPAFPGLSGIPSNSKHFLSSAGLRSESLQWPGAASSPGREKGSGPALGRWSVCLLHGSHSGASQRPKGCLPDRSPWGALAGRPGLLAHTSHAPWDPGGWAAGVTAPLCHPGHQEA